MPFIHTCQTILQEYPRSITSVVVSISGFEGGGYPNAAGMKQQQQQQQLGANNGMGLFSGSLVLRIWSMITDDKQFRVCRVCIPGKLIGIHRSRSRYSYLRKRNAAFHALCSLLLESNAPTPYLANAACMLLPVTIEKIRSDAEQLERALVMRKYSRIVVNYFKLRYVSSFLPVQI